MSEFKEEFAKINMLNVARYSSKPAQGVQRLTMADYVDYLKKNRPDVWTPELERAYPLWIEASTRRIFGPR